MSYLIGCTFARVIWRFKENEIFAKMIFHMLNSIIDDGFII